MSYHGSYVPAPRKLKLYDTVNYLPAHGDSIYVVPAVKFLHTLYRLNMFPVVETTGGTWRATGTVCFTIGELTIHETVSLFVKRFGR